MLLSPQGLDAITLRPLRRAILTLFPRHLCAPSGLTARNSHRTGRSEGGQE